MDDSRIREEIAKTLGGLDSVLDIGCGDCKMVRYLARGVANRAVGIDVVARWSREDLDDGTAGSHRTSCIQGDVHSMEDFPDATFDAVVSVRTLHELSHPAAALLEVRRVLKRGGRVLVADFAKGHEGELTWGERFYTPDEIGRMLDASGFEDINVREVPREHFVFATGLKGS
jgi:ubiquinone/menaquinone biosynthesis C-methylase UbiE